MKIKVTPAKVQNLATNEKNVNKAQVIQAARKNRHQALMVKKVLLPAPAVKAVIAQNQAVLLPVPLPALLHALLHVAAQVVQVKKVEDDKI